MRCLKDAASVLGAGPMRASDGHDCYVYRAGTTEFMRADPGFAIGYAKAAVDQAIRILNGEE